MVFVAKNSELHICEHMSATTKHVVGVTWKKILIMMLAAANVSEPINAARQQGY
jgi:hypothetical protein